MLTAGASGAAGPTVPAVATMGPVTTMRTRIVSVWTAPRQAVTGGSRATALEGASRTLVPRTESIRSSAGRLANGEFGSRPWRRGLALLSRQRRANEAA